MAYQIPTTQQQIKVLQGIIETKGMCGDAIGTSCSHCPFSTAYIREVFKRRESRYCIDRYNNTQLVEIAEQKLLELLIEQELNG